MKDLIRPAISPGVRQKLVSTLTSLERGIRPIAVGCTLRRLIAKVVSRNVMNDMGLGYGVGRGAEAAVYAASRFLEKIDTNSLTKLDFKNAFNSLRHVRMLEAV